MKASIFVSMASYRDTEGPVTLADLFAKAAFPNRVFVGVFWQVSPGVDEDCAGIPPGVPLTQVREIRIDAAESLGVCWARHHIQRELWSGEDYYLQIDSHMRFVQGWDSVLESMLERCRSDLPVVSTYPASYKPGGELAPPVVTVLQAKGFSDQGILLQHTRNVDARHPPARPLPNAFCAAGFLFGPGSLVDAVPYDPQLYFHGEEITLAVRLWTHGYDLFSPDRHVLWHDYSMDRRRPRHWEDRRDWTTISRLSAARVRHLLNAETTTETQALLGIEGYALGTQRLLREYERYADLRFEGDVLGARALDGRFPPHPSRDPFVSNRRRWFESIYHGNVWGASSTRSGSGSTEAATEGLITSLREFLESVGARTLVDAGCGEFGWIDEVADSLDLYIGYDIVDELCERNVAMSQGKANRVFACADITMAPLPRADAVLCRHCLTHLPDRDVTKALELFRQSGSRWLLATTYERPDSKPSESLGWRALDLEHPRFGLGAPLHHLTDLRGASGCRLSAWALNEVSQPVATPT